MIDNFVSMIDERLLQSLSMTLAGQDKITQRGRDWLARGATFGQRSAGAESPSGSGSLVATHVVRSNVATQYRRVAGVYAQVVGHTAAARLCKGDQRDQDFPQRQECQGDIRVAR